MVHFCKNQLVARGVLFNGHAGTIYWPWPLNGTCMAIIWSLMEITIKSRII